MDAHVTDKAGTSADPAGSADADEKAGSAVADGSATPGGPADSGRAGAAPAAEDGDTADTSAGDTAGSEADTTDEQAGATADTTDEQAGAAAGSTAGQDVTPGEDGPVAQDGPSASADHGRTGDADGGRADGPAPSGGGGPGGDNDGNGRGGDGQGGDNGGNGRGGDGDEGPAGGRPPRHWMRWAALGTSLVLLAAAGAGWWFYRKLDSNITTDTTAAAELETYEKERPTPVAVDAQNILLLGSDTRAGEGNSKYGRDENGGSQRSDTTILLHIAADRKSATAMSIPRDLLVTVPSCGKPDGSRSKEQTAQFNWAFQFGGAACTIRTVEKFTGVRIDHHMVIDFRGFKDMVDAVDGVEVCLKEPIDDKDARLKLPAGPQTLHGEEALGFVRARKTLGNGSDTERMERQQQFLGALVKKVQSNGVLLNPTRLYPVLDAATKSITTDPGLDSLKDLYDLTRSLRSIPTEKVQFLTVPRQPHAVNPNRDELVQPEADQLFKSLREDDPVTVVPNGEREGEGTTGEPDTGGTTAPSATPTFPGTNAAEGMCE
ncbi:LCP family protein [Streptomyces pristinaespiralis]|uniref:Transcriptional regulator n=1 Tax=Streptomyces pristinaespiralis TaxID=38300 RepID=A0A0M4DCQ0_STRPR|nr:LCP family protein [Streptomyces pristinaespiralis]ALC22821.1 transcriptional regulator [Streptomyces pristinaespiralis]QMU14629.1 LCP family protein [Streptomyces pristinaespiralis]